MKDLIEYKGYSIEIIQDEHASNPRKEWDHLGTLAAFHRNYDLGDKISFKTPEEVMEHIEETKALSLPVYLYDHGGLSVSTGSFNCQWDSGQLGVIFVERERILKEYSVKKVSKQLKERILGYLKNEVEELNQYLQGDVYGYVIKKKHSCEKCASDISEEVESVWGFYGYENCLSEAKSVVDYLTKEKDTENEKRN